MIVGIVAASDYKKQSTPEMTSNWLKGYNSNNFHYIESQPIKFGDRYESVHLCEVKNRMPVSALNEMTSVDGWYFEVVDGKLIKL